MNFNDEYDFDLVVNDVKKLVIEEIESLLGEKEYRDVCRCQDCVLDIAALALNHLKPAYRSTLSFKGVLYRQKLQSDKYQKAVNKAVKDSIDKVSKNPSHEAK